MPRPTQGSSADLTPGSAVGSAPASTPDHALLAAQLRRTFGPRVLARNGQLSGCFRLDFKEKLFKRDYRDPVLVARLGSAGSRGRLAASRGRHAGAAADCLAATLNPLVAQAAEPLFFLDDFRPPPPDGNDGSTFPAFLQALADACQSASCALLGGRTAPADSAPGSAGGYDVTGFAVGVCELSRAVTPHRCQPDDVVLALASPALPPEVFDHALQLLRDAAIDLESPHPDVDAQRPLIDVLLDPTPVYAKPILAVLRRYRVKKPVAAMAVVSETGLYPCVESLLPDGLRFEPLAIDWLITPIERLLINLEKTTPQQAVSRWPLGAGMVIIVRPHFADSILTQLRRLRQPAWSIGRI
ncbi:MAG: hypothetical protein IT442_09790, partial [Phycisphaeraceae bacterium]|nr:hypothetical protein [Phycisphaeraceae bacterium]